MQPEVINDSETLKEKKEKHVIIQISSKFQIRIFVSQNLIIIYKNLSTLLKYNQRIQTKYQKEHKPIPKILFVAFQSSIVFSQKYTMNHFFCKAHQLQSDKGPNKKYTLQLQQLIPQIISNKQSNVTYHIQNLILVLLTNQILSKLFIHLGQYTLIKNAASVKFLKNTNKLIQSVSFSKTSQPDPLPTKPLCPSHPIPLTPIQNTHKNTIPITSLFGSENVMYPSEVIRQVPYDHTIKKFFKARNNEEDSTKSQIYKISLELDLQEI